MSDNTRSQSQQFSNFFAQSMQDQVTRASSFYAEADKLRAQAMDRAQANVDEAARLTKESFAYAHQLASVWQGLVLESLRKTAEMIAPPGQA